MKWKLANLKSDKSPEPDEIHPRVRKELNCELALPTYINFEESMREGYIPQAWKDGHVTPIFKKREKCQCSNFRPVSLTSLVCTVNESIIRDQITEQLESNNLLSKFQHGFMSGRLCTTQLLTVMDHWTQAIDKGY